MAYYNNPYTTSGVSNPVNLTVPIMTIREVKINDHLLKLVGDEMRKKLGLEQDCRSTLSTAITMLTVLVWIFFAVLLLFRIARRTSSNNATMNSVLNNKIVLALRRIPLSIHFILLLFLSATLSSLSVKFVLFAVGFVGILMIYYAIRTFKTCKQWPLMVAGFILLGYAFIESNLFEYNVESAMIKNLFAYSSLISTILILVNHFIYRPKCNMEDLKAEGDMQSLFELKED